MSRRNSILFVRPDYHCSFFYREEFRKRGWKADIFVDSNYPSDLLYSKYDIIRSPTVNVSWGKIKNLINQLLLFFWWHTIFWKYKTHVYYGNPPIIGLFETVERFIPFLKRTRVNFCWELWLAKEIFGINLIFVPTGCRASVL